MAKRFVILSVMAGLVPAIHALLLDARKAWTPGTSPGVTVGGEA